MKPSLSKMVDEDELSISESQVRTNEIVFKPKKTIAEIIAGYYKWFQTIFKKN